MQTVTWRLGPDAALGLANTIHGPSGHRGRRAARTEPAHDHLATAQLAHEFLAGHDIPAPPGLPTTAQLERLRAIRASIRALLEPSGLDEERWRRDIRAALDPVRFRLDGLVLRSVAPGWDGVLDDLHPAALALADERERLRSCGNPRCRFLFVDRSRRQGRIWCETAVCGNRMRVGRHRRATADAAAKSKDALPAGQPPR
jgi:hypothetical protein